MRKYCLIYDMDGILIDTEPHYLNIGTSLLKEAGVEMSIKEFEKYVGTSSIELWTDIINTFGLSHTPDFFIDKSRKYVLDLLENDHQYPPKVPGIIDFLEKFSHIPSGVASSTSLPLIEKCLEKAGMKHYFRHFTSGHEVPKSKPEPDVFLLAAERIGYAPSECIVIEDSKNGATAAKRAGMICVGFVNPNSGTQDLSMADTLVNSYTEAALFVDSVINPKN